MDKETPQKKAELQLELKKMYYETLELKTLPILDINYSKLKVLIESEPILKGIFDDAIKDYEEQAKTEVISKQLNKIKRLLTAYIKGILKSDIFPMDFYRNEIESLRFGSLYPLIKPFERDLLLPIGQRDLFSFYYQGLEKYLVTNGNLKEDFKIRRWGQLTKWYLSLDQTYINNLAFKIFEQDAVFYYDILTLEDESFYFEYYKSVLLSCFATLYSRLSNIVIDRTIVNTPLEQLITQAKGTELIKKQMLSILTSPSLASVANEFNTTVKYLRNRIDDFCLDNGIEHEGKRGINALKHWAYKKVNSRSQKTL